MGVPSLWSLVAKEFQPSAAPQWASPLDMATALDPRVRRVPALDLINDKLVKAFNTPDSRLIASVGPQFGKSQLCSRRFPLWALLNNPDLRIAIASYEANIARRWGRVVRDDIAQHADRLGLRVRDDLSAQHEWQLKGHEGGIFTAGVGGAMTGRPVDLLLMDDVVKGREQADSPTIREKTWEWWTDTALTRLAPGAPVIMIMTRWHEDDLAGRLLAQNDGWEYLNIPAQADHRPELGETDVLGREPGEFLVSPRGTTVKQWEARKRASGPKTWAALYQGRPSPDEGGILPTDWKTYDQPHWYVRDDGAHLVPGMEREDQELLISADLAFRDTAGSDYVVMQVWLRIGVTVYLCDMVRRRLNFNDTLTALRGLVAKWPQATAKLIEAKANGDAVINALHREVPGLIPVEPEGSKVARASAISPFAFSGNIVLPTARLLPNVEELREEARNFPAGAHDDTIDAMSQAVNQLLLHPLTEGGQVSAEDVFEDMSEPISYF